MRGICIALRLYIPSKETQPKLGQVVPGAGEPPFNEEIMVMDLSSRVSDAAEYSSRIHDPEGHTK